MERSVIAQRVAGRFLFAGPLRDVSKLRYQAVFLMGAAGAGKGYVGYKWLKYMPGGGMEGAARKQFEEKVKTRMSEKERSLSNLKFESAVEKLKGLGYDISLTKGGEAAKIPFRIYTYDHKGKKRLVLPEEYKETLPPGVFKEVERLKDVVFSSPVHEVPSYWRQVNPDLYKEELAGYVEKEPGYVHEMSSEMSKAYFQATLESGDPLFVDGTGKDPDKMRKLIADAKSHGYRTSVIYVWTPLTVSQIRNATRSRNVDPDVVAMIWKSVRSSFAQVKQFADKARVVPNRNDPHDIKAYESNKEKIEAFVRSHTAFGSLRDLIKAHTPEELRDWDSKISWTIT